MKRSQLSPVFLVLAGLARLACAAPPADSGALDATFGSGGKVQLAPAPEIGIASHALDVAVQSDGKTLVAGYDTYNGSCSGGTPCVGETWRITRLKVDGSVDASFGPAQNGTVYYGSGLAPTRAQAVALRADGRIVVAGTVCCHSSGGNDTYIVVFQLKADGTPDESFGDGGLMSVSGAVSGDGVSLARMILDDDGSIDLAGTYHDQASGNQFFFDRVAPDGNGNEPFRFIFGGGTGQDAHAMDVAIDSQGRYVVAGYAPGAHGYDCAVIRIRHDLYDVDNSFGHTDPDDYGYQCQPTPFGGSTSWSGPGGRDEWYGRDDEGPYSNGGYGAPGNQPYPPAGGYPPQPGGNSGYPQPGGGYGPGGYGRRHLLTAQETDQLIQAVKARSFEDQKVLLAKQALAESDIRSEDLRRLLQSGFDFDRGKVELAKYAYQRVADRQNFYRVYDTFSFDSSIREMQQYIEQNRS